ncbi:class I SAM-dependent methyltransferase [Spongiactinospora sp. 9N601]|uniref:class I SAM-dependent methyltransferase n=1 Tax=Spongiactinospora sp. 9N601 TaxID=3375149 RepID=UPI00378FDB68
MNTGTGPGPIARDGSPVEFYAALPPTGEPEVIRAVVPAGGSILELGSGAGRITRPLLDLGFDVVAVDECADMLKQIRGAQTVRSRIEDLAMDRTFDAVLLASQLINTPDDAVRRGLLDCCRRHVAPGGQVLIQWVTPQARAAWSPGLTRTAGEVTITLAEVTPIGPGLLAAVMRYETGGRVWTQSFTDRALSEKDLAAALADSGLRLGRFLTPDRSWFTAYPTGRLRSS